MRKLVLIFLLVMLVVISGCTNSVKKTIEGIKEVPDTVEKAVSGQGGQKVWSKGAQEYVFEEETCHPVGDGYQDAEYCDARCEREGKGELPCNHIEKSRPSDLIANYECWCKENKEGACLFSKKTNTTMLTVQQSELESKDDFKMGIPGVKAMIEADKRCEAK